jgi:hypothetical protein
LNLALYCDVGTAAKLAGVTDRQVRNAIKAGRIKGEKVGHTWMVLRASASAFERDPSKGRPPKAAPKKKLQRRR